MDGLNYCVWALIGSGKNEITTKMSSNEFTPTKMEEPVRVTIKNPKKVAVGERLAKWNRINKKKLAQVAKAEELVQAAKAQESKTNLSYSIGLS